MRPRPFTVLEHARLLIGAPHSFAFPSGHTTSAFAASSGVVLAARRLLKRVPPWGMLALAAAISYSRVYVAVHWPTDVADGRDPGTRERLGGVPSHVSRVASDQEGRTERKGA